MNEFASGQGNERPVTQPQSIEQGTIPALDNHYAAKIAFTSFRLSQGTPKGEGNLKLGQNEFQDNLFKYLHAAYPSWRMDDPDQVTELTNKRVMDLLHPERRYKKGHYVRLISNMLQRKTSSDIHKGIPRKEISPQVTYTVLDFQRYLASTEVEVTQQELTPVLVDNFVSTDAVYLLQRNGRKKANPDSSKFINDPFSSYTIEYVMRGRPTGVAEFDTMCGELRTYILQKIADSANEWPTGKLFEEVIDKYNKHHSEEQQYALPSTETAAQELEKLSANNQHDKDRET